MKRKSIGIVLVAALIALTVFGGTVFAGDPGEQEESWVANYLDYEKPLVPSKPLPESELTRITFSKDWLLENDAEKDPWSIKITFPASWLEKSPPITANDEDIELVVPTNILDVHNESKSADEITVLFPIYYFNGLPTPPMPSGPDIKDIMGSGSGGGSKMDYIQRQLYLPNSGDDIVGASGIVLPYTYENEEEETFLAYHEIEFYGDGYIDAVEIISAMQTEEEDTWVFYAVWNNDDEEPAFTSTSSGQGGTFLYVDVGDDVWYEWWLTSGYYNLYLYYDGWYGDFYYDSTASSEFDEFRGSSEFNPNGGISEEFFVYTNPLTITNLKTSAWQPTSYVDQRLDYDSSDPDADYVGIASEIDSTGLWFYIWATD